MHSLDLRIVDSEFVPIPKPQVAVTDERGKALAIRSEESRWIASATAGSMLSIQVDAPGHERELHRVALRDQVTTVVLGLRKPGQLGYSVGSDRLSFTPRPGEALLRVAGPGASKAIDDAVRKLRVKSVSVLPEASAAEDDALVRVQAAPEQMRKVVSAIASPRRAVQVARVIAHGKRPAVGLLGELIVRFRSDVRRSEAERLAASVGLRIAREVRHAGNGFLLVSGGEPGYEILKAADALMGTGRVEYVEPNLIVALEADQYVPNDHLFAQVPHLGLIQADDAWELLGNAATELRGGSPDVTIGIVDLNGIDPTHPELTATLTDGTGKLVTSVNFATTPIAAQTFAALGGDHGTQCAGSATAAFDNNRGIAGVAPNCHLIGARIGGAADVLRMADLYLWMAGFANGSTIAGFPALPSRSADVISSSWGSTGLALSNTIRDCFDHLTSYGRGGRGCLVCFSLGNSGYGDCTDPLGSRFRAWPTYQKTIGVGSSINVAPTDPIAFSSHADQNGANSNLPGVVDRRSYFSPFGATALRKPDLVAPSHSAYGPALIDPILSTVRVGTGTVDGCPGAATCNDYAFTFGGTSHSTPTVAGAIALILSARADLSWVQVREVLRASCARIDAGQTNVIGQWQDLDGDGAIDYSRWYGAGRLDVRAAVELALDPALALADAHVRENLADDGSIPSTGTHWKSPDIWVRQDASEPIPALGWGAAPPHQNALRGSDNALFCRVRNRGTAPAPAVYLRALLTHWAGLEFAFPADFQPSTNVGSPLPNPMTPGTYLLGETRVDDLAPGADAIVKFTWPAALIPPKSVTVGSATVHWHPCLLVDASPHDGPAPIGGLAAPVQGNNNIAQRNIAIVDAGDSGADSGFVGMIAGTRSDAGVATLVIDARSLRGHGAIRVHLADAKAMRALAAAAMALPELRGTGGSPGGAHRPAPGRCGVTLEERARLRFTCGPCVTIVDAAPGTRILAQGAEPRPPEIRTARSHDLDVIEFRRLEGRIEIPMRLASAQYVPLLVAVDRDGDAALEGELTLTQRRGDGLVAPGYGIAFD
ncbi:MAG TPA: S8 family serine peptidase [Phycisphaerales bacterium]|nr:S8 family serine peptidase [Phycisphaerales bacterium]HMP37702.1 S8 family serine peptidase [Phycisphaerales bacterium]